MARLLSKEKVVKYLAFFTCPKNLLVFAVMGFSSLNIFSQVKTFDQKISGNYSNQTVKEIITDISQKTNIRFSYSPGKIPEDARISVSYSNASIAGALGEIFNGMPVRFEFVDDYIILKKSREELKVYFADNEPEQVRPVTFSGYIKDSRTSEFLIGATVYFKDLLKGAVTNSYGFFSLTVPPGAYQVEISYLGYEKLVSTIDLKNNVKLDFAMDFQPSKLQEVVVTTFGTKDMVFNMRGSQSHMAPSFVEKKPSAMGEPDVIKALEFQPGISFYGDGSSYFHVRGGNFDQNLILLDEATIFNPSHLLGIFSPIIPDAIRSVDIYKADFPVNYGGRLSSVIDIHTKDGNKNRFSGSFDLGYVAMRGTVEGPIKKDASSYFISFRKSYFDEFLKPSVPDLKNLDFSDFTAKVNIKAGAKNRFFLTIYSGEDMLRAKTGTSDHNGLNWSNKSFTLRWNHVFGSRMFLNSSFYASNFDYYLYSSVKNGDYWKSTIGNGSLKEELTWYANPQTTWKFGFRISFYQFNPGNYFRNSVLSETQVSPVNSLESSMWAGAEKEVNSWLKLNYGLRFVSWTNYGKAFVVEFDSLQSPTGKKDYAEGVPYYYHLAFEPRLSASFRMGEQSSIKAGYCRVNQFINLITNSISPFNSLEVWLPSGPNIKPQSADIFDLGYIVSFPRNHMSFQASTFYKNMANQIGYKYHASMLVNPAIEGELRQGRGWAYGLELSARKESGKLTGQVAYTWSRSFLKIRGLNNNQAFPATYDRPHSFSASLAYQSKPRWLYSADFCISSGARITTPTAFYYYQGYQVPVYTKQNNDQFPVYNRFDFSIRHRLNKKEQRFSHYLNFSVLNLLGKPNPIFLNFNKIKITGENGDEFYIPMDKLNFKPVTPTIRYTYWIVPSLTYQLKF